MEQLLAEKNQSSVEKDGPTSSSLKLDVDKTPGGSRPFNSKSSLFVMSM